jgi:hypothetical protein
MSVGTSGRIVLEIDPEQKQELYQALKKDELNMKRWFLKQVDAYLKDRDQLALDFETSNNQGHQERSSR